jgi:endonuclease/exonuclease/phosphatase family metal-dependent hydrolase
MHRIARGIAGSSVVGLLLAGGCALTTISPDEETDSAAVAATGEFTVLSYNVDGLPQIFQDGPPGGNPALFTPIIGQKVRDYDIVNVQEDFNSHAALYANDNHPFRTATTGGAGVGSGLNTMSSFAFSDDIDRVRWANNSNTDGNNLTPKGFTWLRLRIAEGVYIDLYNLHTNAGESDAATAARRANITQIASYIAANSANNAVLVFGDTNARYTRTADNIRDLLAATGRDSWVDVMHGGTPPALGSPALVWNDSATVLTDFRFEFVDKIFFRGNRFIALAPLAYSVEDGKFRDASGNMLSDHRPIFTRFAYTLAANLRLSDQFGGPHGTSYSDVNAVPANPVVRAIGLRAGRRVDQVNIALTSGASFVHGGTGGTAQSLTLANGEFVTRAELRANTVSGRTRIFWVRFTTSSGRAITGGTASGSSATFNAPSGWQIVGFHGRSGTELDKVRLIYTPIP